MSTKTLRKELVAAIAMVLVALLALGSSTFAWFTMNSSVTATGMSVKAAAGTGLVISGYNSDPKSDQDQSEKGWTTAGATVALDALNTTKRVSTLVPTSTVDTDYWFTATADASSAAETTGVYTLYTDGISNNSYSSSVYLYNIVKIQTNDNSDISDKHLVLSNIQATNGTSGSALSADLNKALRIAFVVSDGSTESIYIFSPNEDSYPSINGVKYSSTLAAKCETVEMSSLTDVEVYGSGTSSIDLFASKVPATTTVEMYVYYDGEDENCFTNNTLSGIDQLTVSVEFSAVDNAQK